MVLVRGPHPALDGGLQGRGIENHFLSLDRLLDAVVVRRFGLRDGFGADITGQARRRIEGCAGRRGVLVRRSLAARRGSLGGPQARVGLRHRQIVG